MVLDDGQLLGSSEEVHEGAVQFFQHLLMAYSVENDDSTLELMLPSVQENEELCTMPSIEEVKATLWSIPSDSSLGPNVFSTSCFILAWDIVKDDILGMAK
ncbi:hypothetical protein I3843_03G164600 [Carya illinoinensis]|nr:hypothetical protein I3843_03G164600 [Carya illinoinensis]